MAVVEKSIHIEMDVFLQRWHNETIQNISISLSLLLVRPIVVVLPLVVMKLENMAFTLPCLPSRAIRLCLQAIFVKPRLNIYKETSPTICQIFYKFTLLVEPVSLDEVYLGVSMSSQYQGSAIRIAEVMKQQITRSSTFQQPIQKQLIKVSTFKQ